MKQHELVYPELTENITTDPNWNCQLTVKWSKFVHMHVGDGLVIEGGDGTYLGSIEDIGDQELGENYIIVDFM